MGAYQLLSRPLSLSLPIIDKSNLQHLCPLRHNRPPHIISLPIHLGEPPHLPRIPARGLIDRIVLHERLPLRADLLVEPALLEERVELVPRLALALQPAVLAHQRPEHVVLVRPRRPVQRAVLGRALDPARRRRLDVDFRQPVLGVLLDRQRHRRQPDRLALEPPDALQRQHGVCVVGERLGLRGEGVLERMCDSEGGEGGGGAHHDPDAIEVRDVGFSWSGHLDYIFILSRCVDGAIFVCSCDMSMVVLCTGRMYVRRK